MQTILKVSLLLSLLAHSTGFPDTYTFNERRNVIGEVKTVYAHQQDTLLDIAFQYDLGYEELIRANPGVDPWLPGGNQIILPTQFILPEDRSDGIHINLSEYRLYYFHNRNKVMIFPISIGRGEWQTPVGNAFIQDKIVHPSWYPTAEIRREHKLRGDPLPTVVPPGPDNPLGKFALQLNFPGYFIHGTNRPYGIGMTVTHGCVRLRPDDIAVLFDAIQRKTTVKIYYEPYKSAIQGDSIYFEANVALTMQKEVYLAALTRSIQKTIELAGRNNHVLDWDRIATMVQHKDGVPRKVNFGASHSDWVKTPQATTVVESSTGSSVLF